MDFSPPKRILILRNTLLLNAGIQKLLSGRDSFKVVGKDFESQNELLQHIESEQPDVIIVDDDFHVANLAEMLKFLDSYPKTRTILMSLEENRIRIYDTMQIELEGIEDFLAVL